MTMCVLAQRLMLACLITGGCTSTTADNRAMQDAVDRLFPSSFEVSCRKAILEQAMRDYAGAAGVEVEPLPDAMQERIRTNAEPLFATCACMRGRFNPQVQHASNTETKVTLEVWSPALEECRPSAETALKVRLGLMGMLQATPAPTTTMRTKRTPFSINVTAQMRPSLWGSYDRPPAGLARLVFLARGTGSACSSRMLCLDKASLEISKVSDFRAKHSWTSQSLGPVTRLGQDAQIITSPHNYTNFESSQTAGQAAYPVAFIDRVPIEMTKAKRIWLVIFHDMEADPKGIDFVPAVTEVMEIEFEDAG